ncbi:hypothetical protein LI90_3961 [Carbonactinospora thermoautotrophica]|uniref:Uncharacterized protein n=1 Tax=Carbonactinospora thermoautotrophica TaxID=1469144 RepID=A0A132MZZ4_9ACTN|nr:hypothetical protein LI90_3961 [Carbonactinospora thermoautotrophica]
MSWATHPHVRGEDLTTKSAIDPPNDSPPRAWGGLPDLRPRVRGDRLTPTCVGRTLWEM